MSRSARKQRRGTTRKLQHDVDPMLVSVHLLADKIANTTSLDNLVTVMCVHLKKHISCEHVLIFREEFGQLVVHSSSAKLSLMSGLTRDIEHFLSKSQNITHELPKWFAEIIKPLLNGDDKVIRTSLLHSIHDASAKVLAVLVAINKTIGQFVPVDSRAVDMSLKLCMPTLYAYLLLDNERTIEYRAYELMDTSKQLFGKMDRGLPMLLHDILSSIKHLVDADGCSFFSLERNVLTEKVYLGPPSVATKITKGHGIVGTVAQTGRPIITNDPLNHILYDITVDAKLKYTMKNLICVPIKNNDDVVMAVAQIFNKTKGYIFTKYDLETAINFSFFCSAIIQHSMMYDRASKLLIHNKHANELMLYRRLQDVNRTMQALDSKHLVSKAVLHEGFDSLDLDSRFFKEIPSLKATLGTFKHLGIVHKFMLNETTLYRFVMMVKSSYRDVPFHNWSHAFSASQFAFAISEVGKLETLFTPLEVFALYLGMLCHDLDHRGTNNTFQMESNSSLASLYSSMGSILERHHLDQAFAILNTDGCNILSRFSVTDYLTMMNLIQLIILATDLGNYFEMKSRIENVIPIYSKNNIEHRRTLLSLLATVCDLNDQAKPWYIAKKCAAMVYLEFFNQGDMEKKMGVTPIDLMDRDKSKDIPAQQIVFLERVVGPAFHMLGAFIPGAMHAYENTQQIKKKWLKVKQMTQNAVLCMKDGDFVIEHLNLNIDSCFADVNSIYFLQLRQKCTQRKKVFMRDEPTAVTVVEGEL